MSAPFANIIGLLKTYRYVVLAGTVLPALALPLWSVATDTARAGQDTIILAQDGGLTLEQRRLREQQQKGKQPPPAPPKAAPAPPPPQPKQQQVVPPQPKQQQVVPPQPKQQQVVPPQPKQQQVVQPPPQQQPAQPKQPPQPQQPAQPRQPPPQQQPAQPKQPPQPQQPAQPRQPPPQQQPAQPQQGVPPQPPPAAQIPQQQVPQTGQQKKDGRPKDGRPAVAQPPAGQPPAGQQPGVGQQPAVGRQQPGVGQQPGVVQPAPPLGQPGQQGAPGQFVRPAPQGPANVEALRGLRQERREAGGRVVIVEPGGRTIVRDRGQVFIRQDDRARFNYWGPGRVERRGGEVFNVYRRPDGVEIITVTDANGRLLRRIRREPDRREFVLIDNRPRVGGPAGFFLNLPPPPITIPRERYIVDVGSAPPALLYETLEAPPLVPIERAYTLDEVRYNAPLRDRMPRIDIDTITFSTGSWEVTPDQYPALEAIAQAILRVIENSPTEVFLVEGHTDAVGNADDNLSLSDRRAESVANILTQTYMVPPENLVTQGYGAQVLGRPNGRAGTQLSTRHARRVGSRLSLRSAGMTG